MSPYFPIDAGSALNFATAAFTMSPPANRQFSLTQSLASDAAPSPGEWSYSRATSASCNRFSGRSDLIRSFDVRPDFEIDYQAVREHKRRYIRARLIHQIFDFQDVRLRYARIVLRRDRGEVIRFYRASKGTEGILLWVPQKSCPA